MSDSQTATRLTGARTRFARAAPSPGTASAAAGL